MNLHLKSKFKLTTKITSILVFVLTILFVNYQSFAQGNEFVVVLDAGHGGKDPGKVGINKAKEKDIALNVVLKIGEFQPVIHMELDVHCHLLLQHSFHVEKV